MKVRLLCYGITRDITGSFQYELELKNGATILDLKTRISEIFPVLKDLSSLRIAINTEYGEDSDVISEKDEIVLIPPVSGG